MVIMRKSPVNHYRRPHTRKGKSVSGGYVGNGSAVSPTFKYPTNKDDDYDKWGLSDRQNDQNIIANMRTYGVDDDERVSKKLEHFEDKYGVDLTHFYGEDFTKQSTRIKLKKKLGIF